MPECRIDLVTGRSLDHVPLSAEKVRDAIIQSNDPLVRIPSAGDLPLWLNPAHIVLVQDTAEGGDR